MKFWCKIWYILIKIKFQNKEVPTDLPYFFSGDDAGTQLFFCFGIMTLIKRQIDKPNIGLYFWSKVGVLVSVNISTDRGLGGGDPNPQEPHSPLHVVGIYKHTRKKQKNS